MEGIQFLVVKKIGILLFSYHCEKHRPCSLSFNFINKHLKEQNSIWATNSLSITYFILTLWKWKKLMFERRISRQKCSFFCALFTPSLVPPLAPSRTWSCAGSSFLHFSQPVKPQQRQKLSISSSLLDFIFARHADILITSWSITY